MLRDYNKNNRPRILFVSKSLLKQYLHKYPQLKLKARCSILYNGIPNDHYMKPNKNKKKITFLYSSVWRKYKGFEHLTFLIKNINKKHHDKVHFIISGSIDLWSQSKQQYEISENNFKEIFKLEKKYSNIQIKKTNYAEMPKLYNKAHFLLFPSIWYEPFSLSVLESLSSGTPVIAYNKGGTKEIINNNKTGYLIQKVNKQLLLKRVESIINFFNKDEYLTMSQNSYKVAKTKTLHIRNKKLVSILMKD